MGNVSGRAGGCQSCRRGVNKLVFGRRYAPPPTSHKPHASGLYLCFTSQNIFSCGFVAPSLLLVGIWWCICLRCVLRFWILPVHRTCDHMTDNYHDALISQALSLLWWVLLVQSFGMRNGGFLVRAPVWTNHQRCYGSCRNRHDTFRAPLT